MESTLVSTKIDNLLESALLKYQDRDYLGALAQYHTAIELNPQHALAYTGRGISQYQLGGIIEAMSDYTHAIDLDPNLAIAYYRRGIVHYVVKNYARAFADYDRAILLQSGSAAELSPTYALAHANRGYVYRQLGDEQEASLSFQQAAQLFKRQGNLKKHDSMLRLVDEIDNNSWSSGML